MKAYGIDFTSRPKRHKPITCLACELKGTHLEAGELQEWTNFEQFEAALQRPGPWIAGIDFPFGQAKKFIETIHWPTSWQGYVKLVGTLTRQEFRDALNAYREPRPAGNKEHRRHTDKAAGSISPQKLYGVPVGLMFFEGAPRLQRSGVTIPHMQIGDPNRIVVEAYPGVLARHLIGHQSYKQDTKAKQTRAHYEARKDLLAAIRDGKLLPTHGLTINAPDTLIDDPGADHLDALLCAIQAAWAWTQRNNGFGAPNEVDPLEGWIADPTLDQGGA